MLNVAVMRFIFYANGTITSLSNDIEIVTCDNGVWPNADAICKKDKSYVIIETHKLLINYILLIYLFTSGFF